MRPGIDYGKCFELYVADIFRNMGRWSVDVNVHYYFRRIFSGKLIKHLQVDIEYREILDARALSVLSKAVVECKYHSRQKVGCEELEQLIAKQRWILADYYLLATNSNYSRDAKALAKKNSIRLYDGMDLTRLDDRYRIFGKKTDLEKRIEEYGTKPYPAAQNRNVRRIC